MFLQGSWSFNESTQDESKPKVDCSIIFGFILPPFGLLFALVSLSQIKKDKTQDGRSIALVGLVISIILNVFILLFILAIILIKISV